MNNFNLIKRLSPFYVALLFFNLNLFSQELIDNQDNSPKLIEKCGLNDLDISYQTLIK